jgi:DNA-directed RNA polymerase beta subunit
LVELLKLEAIVKGESIEPELPESFNVMHELKGLGLESD